MSQLTKFAGPLVPASISLTGDTGGALVGGAFTIHSNVAANNAGSTVAFAGAGTTLTFDVTDGVGNTIIANQAGNATLTGTGNTALGQAALNALTSGEDNVALGGVAGNLVTTGNRNTFVGTGAGLNLATGNNNIALGYATASSYTGAETNNIIIGNSGTLGDAAITRIGTNGTQTEAHIAGIAGVVVANQNFVTVDTATGQLGSTAGGSLASSFPTDSGTATPAAGVLTVAGGLNLTTTGAASTVTVAEKTFRLLNNYSVANSSPYVVASTAFYITVDTTTIPIMIQLPNAPTQYQYFIIKDSGGMASTNNVTVTTVAGVLNIDAAPTFVMNTDYEAIQVVYSGFGYEVF